MHRPGPVIPIPSSKTRVHLDANAAALTLELSQEELDRIDNLCAPAAIAGRSYYAPKTTAP